LAFAFWELHTMIKGYSGDAYAAWSATGIMIVVEILALGALASAWEVYHQQRLIDHYIFIVAMVVLVLNIGAAWGGNRRWQRLRKEFESYPMPIRIGGGVVVVALIILTVIAVNYFGAASARLPR
jgi:peptidoglycan/LPS O-acetylase OafA/YrhL